ncbi:MAG: tetratricopeptide repeat protein [Candidatus Odinarchaeota archaeon]
MVTSELSEIELELDKGSWKRAEEFILQLDEPDTCLVGWLKSELAYQKKDFKEAKQGCLSVLEQINENHPDLHLFQAKCKITLGKIARAIGDLNAAQTFYTEALDLLRAGDPSSELALVNYLLGNLFLVLKNFKKAEKHYREYLALSTSLKLDPWYVARAHYGLGNFYYYQGLFDDAKQEFQQGLSFFQEEETDLLLADLCINLGSIYYQRSSLDSASKRINQAIRIYNALNDHLAEIVAIQKLVQVFIEMVEKSKALELMNDTYYRFKNKSILSVDFILFRALILLEDGQVDEAREQLESLLKITNLSLEQESQILDHLIKLYYFEEKYVEALELAKKLQGLYKGFEDVYDYAVAASHAGLALIQLDRSQEGIKEIEHSIKVFTKIKDHNAIAHLLYSAVIAFLSRSQYIEALNLIKRELNHRKKHVDLDATQELQLLIDIVVLSKISEDTGTFDDFFQQYKKKRSQLIKKIGIADALPKIGRLSRESTLRNELRAQMHEIEEEIQKMIKIGV